jgi:hypothetical protein
VATGALSVEASADAVIAMLRTSGVLRTDL